MNKVDVLCNKHSEMMMEFSVLCLRHLKKYPPLKLLLAVFQPFLDSNVLKEIDKDRLIIEYAAAEFEKGTDSASIDMNELFKKTKKIDNEYAKKLSNPLLSIEVKHEDLAEIRKKRIAAIVGMVFDLLHNWRDVPAFPATVKRTFTEESYKGVLGEILHLYNVETRILSNSITFHGPAGRMKDLFADKLFGVMEKTAAEVAASFTRRIYSD